MTNNQTTDQPKQEPDDGKPGALTDVRRKLLWRIGIAGVMVVGLLGGLALFDYLAAPGEAPEVEYPKFTEPVPVPKKALTQPVVPVEPVTPPPEEETKISEPEQPVRRSTSPDGRSRCRQRRRLMLFRERRKWSRRDQSRRSRPLGPSLNHAARRRCHRARPSRPLRRRNRQRRHNRRNCCPGCCRGTRCKPACLSIRNGRRSSTPAWCRRESPRRSRRASWSARSRAARRPRQHE